MPAAGPQPAPPGRPGLAIGLAIAATLPGVFVHATGVTLEPLAAVFMFGLAVVGAAFMLAWAAEAVQLDVSAGLAIALLALVAVLPEYAVDFVFTWKAGKDPVKYAPDALANMTGGNQLLIGVGWSMVVLIGAYPIRASRRGREIRTAHGNSRAHRSRARTHALDRDRVLVIATLYGLTLPLHRTLTLFDAAILVTVFVLYMVRVARLPGERTAPRRPFRRDRRARDPPAPHRGRAALRGSVAAILICAEPFAESLVDTGRHFHIDDFVLISLVAPLASEAPELIVAGMFAWRLQSSTGLGALMSSKVNQWTLLVGTLPIVFAILVIEPARPPDRRGAARGAVRDRRAVGLCRRDPGQSEDQRG